MAYHDLNNNILWANHAYEEATGLSRSEIVGRKCYSVWGLAKPCRGCPVLTAIDSGLTSEAELTPQNQDHWPESQGYWLSRAAPVCDNNGQVIGAVEAAFDIADRKQAEQELGSAYQQLQASNQQLRASNQQLEANNQQLRATEQQLRASNQQLRASNQQLEAANQQLHVTEHEMREHVKELGLLHAISDIVEKEAGLEGILQATVDSIPGALQYPEDACARILLGEQEFKTKDFQQTRHELLVEIAVQDEPAGVLEAFYREDNSGGDERQFIEMERRLLRTVAERLGRIVERNRAAQDLATIFEMSNDMICIADINKGTFKRVNPAFSRILGYDKAEILGAEFLSFNHPDDVEPTHRVVEEQLKRGEIVLNFENRYRCKDGSYKWLEWVSAPDAEQGLTFAIARDVTQRKRDEAERRELTESLERSNQELEQHRQQLEELVEERTLEVQESRKRLHEETAATAAIVNELLTGEADDLETETQMLNACLAATSSKFGMIGVINEHGNFDTTTYNSESLEQCVFPETMAWDLTTGMAIRGIWGWPMIHGEPLICNDLDAHPERVGQPKGHAPICSFLGVPVKDGDKVTGMVAVANKAGGYTEACRQTLSRLVAIMTVSRRYRKALSSARLTASELDRKVRQRTADLEATNRELESFAYSISHDLRAPLRAIDGFSQAFMEDYGDLVDRVGVDYLNRVRAGAQHMGKLIDDLLQLSRLSRVETKRVEIDLSALAHQICDQLQFSEPERTVDVDIAVGLRAYGDPTLMESALQNLIANSWKFTAKEEQARIELGVTEIDSEPTFFVRDNGAGFDMAYSDKLFGVFQRLHDTLEFPGTGVGLAIVLRVIKRHGGRVWGEAVINEGATFYFTLPEE